MMHICRWQAVQLPWRCLALYSSAFSCGTVGFGSSLAQDTHKWLHSAFRDLLCICLTRPAGTWLFAGALHGASHDH